MLAVKLSFLLPSWNRKKLYIKEKHIPVSVQLCFLLQLCVWFVRCSQEHSIAYIPLLHKCLTLFAVHFTTLLVAQTVQHPVIGLLMNTELGRMWKEAVMAYLNVPLRHLSRGADKNHEKHYLGYVSGLRFRPHTSGIRNKMLTTW
jgi:hypothetical protein